MDKDKNSNARNTGRTGNQEGFHTIFDDVFRTIAQKMPFLLIPLINEVFQTTYSEDQEFEQLRNEHYETFGKIITDSIIRIEDHLYHMECQSQRDGGMALRMVEYDFAIAVESSKMEDGIIEIDFPESCVLYIRNHSGMPDYHMARIRFADGQTVHYKVPVIMAQDYTVDHIFKKRLLALLPYHILRYEHFLKSNSADQAKIGQFLDDYRMICERLQQIQGNGDASGLYVDLITLINKLADHVIPDCNPVKERFGEIMGGQILKLRSEELIEQTLYSSVQDGDMLPDRAAKRLNISVPELKMQMQERGYHFPER